MVTRGKDLFRTFYTKSEQIVDYMVTQLGLEPGMEVLEPSAGDGIFVDTLLAGHADIKVDLIELNPLAVNFLQKKYAQDSRVSVSATNTLTSESLALACNLGGRYDRVIGNPPYGAWLDAKERKLLRRMYPGLYVKESYALFMYRCIKLLRDGGILVFIIPDTFLNLHRHSALRQYLLTTTRIHELALFPSSFFPGVNFGYSNLCIATLQKWGNRDECLANKITIRTGFRQVSQLPNSSAGETSYVAQAVVYENPDHALYLNADPKVAQLITRAPFRVGDFADCVTGFYSGNDAEFLRSSGTHRNGQKYVPAQEANIVRRPLTADEKLHGFSDERHLVPLHKGGARKFVKPTAWYMDWSCDAVDHYKRDSRARYQNSDYYFMRGIGIPMVSSHKLTAALIEEELFDQSIVGIFPKHEQWTYYLLGFFNSETCTKLIRTINPTANNSANYIKKIPLLLPPVEELEPYNELVKRIIELRKLELDSSMEEKILNDVFRADYGF